jgi:hypothetical protein
MADDPVLLQLVRKDMDLNEHERISKIQNAYFFTSKNLKDPIVIVNCRAAIKTLPLYLNLCLSVILEILSCSFKSISFLTNWSKTGSSAIIFKFKNSTKIFDKLPNMILHNDHSIHYHP